MKNQRIKNTMVELPAYWSSALVDGDYSGLTDDDVYEVKDWLELNNNLTIVSCSEKPELKQFLGLLTSVLKYDCHTIEINKPRIKNTIQHPTRGRLVCRIWDNQGETLDRYTIAFKGYQEANRYGMTYPYLGCSNAPFEGVGYHGESPNFVTGKHLGKRIGFESLPDDVQKFILQSI